MELAKPDEREVVFFIADISGYTRFILSNEKAQSHSLVIVRDLMNTILQEVKMPFQLLRLEGDAAFLYIDKADPQVRWDFVGPALLDKLIQFFRVFAQIAELSVHRILLLQCLCQCRKTETEDDRPQRHRTFLRYQQHAGIDRQGCHHRAPPAKKFS